MNATNIPAGFLTISVCPNNTRDSNWSLHPLFFRKPPCSSTMRPFSSAMLESLFSRILHTTLLTKEVKEIPRNVLTSHTPLTCFLGTGTTLSLHKEGTLPYSQQNSNRASHISNNLSVCIMFITTPSSPGAFSSNQLYNTREKKTCILYVASLFIACIVQCIK